MLVAQDLPNTNVYMFDIEKESDSLYHFNNPKFLTNFNADGYNNQPAFMSENELYLTVGIPGANQTDIYKLDIGNTTKLQVTRTQESEYSPTLMPDNRNFGSSGRVGCQPITAFVVFSFLSHEEWQAVFSKRHQYRLSLLVGQLSSGVIRRWRPCLLGGWWRARWFYSGFDDEYWARFSDLSCGQFGVYPQSHRIYLVYQRNE